MSLVACPFCREMFEEGEQTSCPVCGVELTDFTKLPPSLDALAEDDGVPVEPSHEPLPLAYLGRGKGALAALALAGMALFFLPWIHMSMPYELAISGFDLARVRLGWVWAAGVAWVVLVPTVLSRRSIHQMRGARLAAGFLSAIPGVTVAVLLAFPPKRGIVRLSFVYEWPIWATLLVSLVALYFAVRLGGRVDDIAVRRGSSKGQHLH